MPAARVSSCATHQPVGNDLALDLGGAFEDGGEPGIPPVPFDGALRGIAVAAVDLDALACDALGHLGGEELRHRRLDLNRLAGVAIVRGLVHECARRFDLGCHVGRLEAHRLNLRDRLAELHPLLGIRERVLESAAGEADRAGSSMDPRHVESVHRGVESASLGSDGPLVHARTEEIAGGYAQPVEPEVVRGDAVIAYLVDRATIEPLWERAALLLDEETFETSGSRPLTRVFGASEQQDKVSVERVAAPALLS